MIGVNIVSIKRRITRDTRPNAFWGPGCRFPTENLSILNAHGCRWTTSSYPRRRGASDDMWFRCLVFALRNIACVAHGESPTLVIS